MAREVAAAFASVANDWELVFVDDGSRDGTWAKIVEAARANPRVRGVRHLRNAGQSAALWTGIQQTGGFRVREIPVNHRPRVAGVSKYGVWNRLGRGLYDLVAVAWYQRRRLKPVPVERTNPAQ
ncbi:MAG: glycosyltransferase [Proteobacteria bacterium]|nr:glycosyltransferase [Pseudomonadota bacterium]